MSSSFILGNRNWTIKGRKGNSIVREYALLNYIMEEGGAREE